MKVKNFILFIRNEEEEEDDENSNPEADISGLWSGRFNKGHQGN